MKKIILQCLLIFTCSISLRAQIYTGQSAIGIRIDTLNLVQNGNVLSNFYLNCDTTVSALLKSSSNSGPSPGSGTYTSGSELTIYILDTSISMGTKILLYPGGTGTTYRNLGTRLDSGILLNDTSSIIWSTNDTIGFNTTWYSIFSQYHFNYYNKYFPLRKKYGNEYLYGWIYSSSNTGVSYLNNYPYGNFIYQMTKFPKLKVIYDTLVCQSSYTFADGFSLNNILHDTVYDFVVPSTTAGCDSLVRTKITIPSTYLLHIYDTVCAGIQYTFPDSSIIANITNDTTHTNVLALYNGCDSLVISHVHVVDNTFYDTVKICNGSNYTFPDGVTYTNILYNYAHMSHFNSVTGCDSNILTKLLVLPSETIVNLVECDQYYFNNQIITSSGTYYDTLTNSLGCDSIINLNLTISKAVINSLTASPNTICNQGNSALNATILPPAFCIPTVYYQGLTYDYISNFTFNNTAINNSTGDGPGDYNYYSNLNANVIAGMSYPFSLISTAITNAVWVDYNQDGDFLDLGESVFYTGNSSTNYDSITIPLNALNGKTRLRVACRWGSNQSLLPCNNPGYGEYEDYNITISGGVDNMVWSPSTFLNNSIGNSVNVSNINTTTTYTVTATNGNGCTTTSNITINVVPSSQSSINQTACDSYTFNNQTLTQSGTYYDTLMNANGCDSIITLNLTINNSTNLILNQTACDSFIFNNQTHTANGTYYDTLLNANGCDSIITLNLTINNSTNLILNQTACDSFSFNNQTLTQNGTYYDTLVNANGCDSIITLNLTMNNSTTSTQNISACDSFSFNNQTLTQSGTYYDTLVNANGCDSIITLNLTINNSTTNTQNVSACDSFSFNNLTLTQSGTYYDTLMNANGCDSIITLNLTMNNSTTSTQNISACDSFSFNNQTLTQSGTYYDTLVNANGCDSIITLNLTMNNSTNLILNQTACDSFSFNNQTLTQNGTYYDTLMNANGCDSIIRLNLSINTSTSSSIIQSGFTLTSTIAGAMYQWIRCIPNFAITGATSQSYTPSINGNYAVIVTQNGCSDTSNCVSVTGVGVEDYLQNNISINPNPSTGVVRISSIENLQNTEIKVLSLTGQIILQKEHVSGKNVDLDLSSFANGIYFIEIKTGNETYREKMVKE